MTAMPRFSQLLMFALALAGCSSSSEDAGAIVDSPLSGKVGGQSWTLQVGATDPFLSQGDGDLVAALYAAPYTPCVDPEPSGSHLFVSVPRQPGAYGLSLMRNITFVVGESDNRISLDGQIVVDEVTATTISGGLRTRYDDGNDVNGQFQLTICPPQ